MLGINLLLCFLSVSNGWLILNRKLKPDKYVNVRKPDKYGDTLMLTPYLDNSRLKEARDKAVVEPFVGNVRSYSGFFTVDKDYDSNMFFWYFPAENGTETAPVVLWLNGGPGVSSLYGLFQENGPYTILPGNRLVKRDIYWSKTMNVLYVDNPVGTGFSFTANSSGYSRNESTVGMNLYRALTQFFTLFPELQKNEFYATGESYAGKYVPALCYTIHKQNPKAKIKINLKGLAIGNGVVDPINQLNYADLLIQIGLIDENQKKEFQIVQNRTVDAINRKDYPAAYAFYNSILESLFFPITGFTNAYNFLISDTTSQDKSTSMVDHFFDCESIKATIHVGKVPFRTEDLTIDIYKSLTDDMVKSVAPLVSVLADNYNVLMYNGQLDVIVGYPLTANYIDKLPWCGASEFASAPRHQWRVEGKLAGYVKTSAPKHCNGSLSLVLVRDAGHMVPSDQPLWAYNLISNFTSNKS